MELLETEDFFEEFRVHGLVLWVLPTLKNCCHKSKDKNLKNHWKICKHIDLCIKTRQ